ncbi:protein AF-10-like isoform X2 [Lineus longissimus]|uniref:protein AF-10-like isoform X2 n=1 Tax=Lineus longissimus TaxID=88925 RepID=UPI00315DA74D
MREMVGGCCVCSDERGWAENPLVYCDGHGCCVAVHQACYGIVQVPTGPWFCRKCESQERVARVKCELCPSKDGALKRTDNGGWAHVVCALYIPEVRFGNVSTMEPIIIASVPHDRFNKVCYICEEQGRESRAASGACMQCNKNGCKQHFHVTCAQAQGLLCEEQGNYTDNVKYCGYCAYHYKKLKKDSHIKTIPAFKPVSSAASTPESTPEKQKEKPQLGIARPRDPKVVMTRMTTPTTSTVTTVASSPAEPPATTTAPLTALATPATPPTPVAPSPSNSASDSEKKPKSFTAKFTTANFVETTLTNSPVLTNCLDNDVKLEGKREKVKTRSSLNRSDSISSMSTDTAELEGKNSVFSSSSEMKSDETEINPGLPDTVPKVLTPSTTTESIAIDAVVPMVTNAVMATTATTFDLATTSSSTVLPQTSFSNTFESFLKGNYPNTDLSKSGSSESMKPVTTPLSGERPAKRSRSRSSEKAEKKKAKKAEKAALKAAAAAATSQFNLSKQVKDMLAAKAAEEGGNGPPSPNKKARRRKSSKSREYGSPPSMMSLSATATPASSLPGQRSESTSVPGTGLIFSQEQNISGLSSLHSDSTLQNGFYSGPLRPTRNILSPRMGGSGDHASNSFPATLEQLLERQWEQGSQFLMEQAQHFDIASLLNCLNQLRAENQRLEEHISSLVQRRDHLLAINARLSLPLNSANSHSSNPGSHHASPEAGSITRSPRVNNVLPIDGAASKDMTSGSGHTSHSHSRSPASATHTPIQNHVNHSPSSAGANPPRHPPENGPMTSTSPGAAHQRSRHPSSGHMMMTPTSQEHQQQLVMQMMHSYTQPQPHPNRQPGNAPNSSKGPHDKMDQT